MIKYLELLWKQLNCEHCYEKSYTEMDNGNTIDYYICIKCGKKYGKIKIE